MLEIISKRSQLHSIIVKVFQSLGVLSLDTFLPIAIVSLVSASVFFIVDCGIAVHGKRSPRRKLLPERQR